MRQVQDTAYLVTVAEDLSSEPVMKVWALDRTDKKTNSPVCLSTTSIQNGRRQFPITSFAALDDLSQLAIGFANGSVTVVRGDLIHDRGAKQRTVFESEEPVTAVDFREGNTTALYIATTTKVLTLIISGKGQGQPARTIDEQGCAFGCMVIDQQSKDVVIARDDAIYYYGLHGKGSRFAFDGQKSVISTSKDYIVTSYPSSSSSLAGSSLASFSNGSAKKSDSSSIITVLNVDFHVIAYSAGLQADVQNCFSVWGDLFVLTADGKMWRYREKTLQERLEVLYQRSLFVLAIQMAQKAGADVTLQNTIFRKYGDYLYQNKDFDTAMQQYLRAIDNTEPSQVIRKYLGTQRIRNLIEYLEELHEHQRATSDHTTLLLNCYAKLKDVGKLEDFIKNTSDANFDVDTAISMCRQGGYHEQAAYLARKHSDHDLVVSILVEDLKKFSEALAYIWRLQAATAYPNLSRYATVLLEHCQEDATQMFIEYYTGRFRPKQDAVVVTSKATPAKSSGFASSAVQNLAALLPLPYMNMSSPDHANSLEHETQTHVVESTVNDEVPSYSVPRPRTAFSAFVDHPDAFVSFLEACLNAGKLGNEDKSDVYTTLFEMYLREAGRHEGEAKTTWEAKAKHLAQNETTNIDKSNLFLLSELERFQDGSTLVREQQGLKFDIFRSYTTAKDTQGAIKALRKYGPSEPQLYPAALSYFTSDAKVLEDAGPELETVLQKIGEERLMAPLQVIQTLSSNSVATMGLVKKYLQDSIGKERDEISKNRRMIDTYRKDTSTKVQELETLTSKPTSFTAQRCHSCGSVLDQPIVHFMCKHSFHQRCLNVAEDENIGTVSCPTCAPQNATLRAIRRAQDESKEKHEVFKEALGRSKDGFGTVAEWYGRGVMGVSGAE
ncbi:MAG: hypothetical protein M1828_004608 [Chrysothrix sp. TS-e1954]|nr:MAG: hypothetical protein M1828_004608 [Chrysothrix sp. TS-e1954]